MVEAVDAQNFLGHVGGPSHVAAVRGNGEFPSGAFSLVHRDVQRSQDGFQPALRDVGAQKACEPTQIEFDLGVLDGRRVHVFCGGDHLGSGPFRQQLGATFRSQAHGVGVDAALKPKARVGAQRVALGALAHGHRVEPGRFKDDFGRAFRHPAVQAAVNAGKTHGFGRVGDDEVFGVELAAFAVKGGEGFALGGLADDDSTSANLVEVKCVQGVAKLVQHQIGRVHHVVQGLDADGAQPLLGPVWAGAHLDVVQFHRQVVGAVFGGLHGQRHGGGLLQSGIQIATLGQHEVVGGHGADAFHGAVQQPGPEVPRHAPMAHGVVSVGGQSDFDDVVPFEAHHLGHVCPHGGVMRQHHDAIMP